VRGNSHHEGALDRPGCKDPCLAVRDKFVAFTLTRKVPPAHEALFASDERRVGREA
jgi:hypothetical protein